MSERDRMFGVTSGKGDIPRPTDLKKYRERFPASMGKKKSKKIELKKSAKKWIENNSNRIDEKLDVLGTPFIKINSKA